jgi:hypothetical protein
MRSAGGLSGRTSARGAGTLIPAGHARLPRTAAHSQFRLGSLWTAIVLCCNRPQCRIASVRLCGGTSGKREVRQHVRSMRPDRLGHGGGRRGGRRAGGPAWTGCPGDRAAARRRGMPLLGMHPVQGHGARRRRPRRGGQSRAAGWQIGGRAGLDNCGNRVAEVSEHWDDARAADRLERSGATLLRGSGQIVGPAEVEVGGRRFAARKGLVIATGT